jgi:hypothetical protein
VIEPNIRHFVDNNAQGIFMQAAGNAWGAELSDLRNYVMSELLWDPKRSADTAINEFLDLHYGPAADPIRAFIEHVHDKAEASGKHQNCFGRLANYGLDASDADKGLEAFEKALAAADSDAVRERVEKASLCAYRAALEPIWYRSEGTLPQEQAAKMRPLARRFFELCEKHHVDRPQESGDDTAATKKRLAKLFDLSEGEAL